MLADVPGGTRTVDVKAVTYYPQRMAVNVMDGTPPLRTALTTLKAMLDTIKVTASRVRNRDLEGFEERRQASNGRFITLKDIERRAVIETSQLLRTTPGLTLENDTVLMRGTFTDLVPGESRCRARIYIDGHVFPDITVSEIDSAVKPERIAGIEVYVGGTTPPQYQEMFTGCGSVVIWTKK
jgi:hypothetical protein